MSAGSAASGVTNLNRTGIRHRLHVFCDRIAISISFAVLGFFLRAASADFDQQLLLIHYYNCCLISTLKLIKKTPVIPSHNHSWLIFDMMSAGSAASGVTNLNQTGIQHRLHVFCDRIAVSISFAVLGFFFLAASAVFDVIWLSKYSTSQQTLRHLILLSSNFYLLS
ncbi:hypothetical protein MKW92_009302 [Papaver armeniacum]|nr:hypothetical protein MKW92_009302 [Papaver armeniacum]